MTIQTENLIARLCKGTCVSLHFIARAFHACKTKAYTWEVMRIQAEILIARLCGWLYIHVEI